MSGRSVEAFSVSMPHQTLTERGDKPQLRNAVFIALQPPGRPIRTARTHKLGG